MRAFTLLETLIYIALFSLLLSGIFVSAVSIKESAGRTAAAARLISEEIYLRDMLEYDIRTADAIENPQTDATSSALEFTEEGVHKSIFVSSSTLEQSEAGDVLPVSDSGIEVENLSFYQSSSTPSTLKVNADLETYASGGNISLPLSFTIYNQP